MLQEQQLQQHQKEEWRKTLYTGNLSKDVTEEDLYSFLSLNTTKNFRQKSHLELIKCEKTGKSKGLAFAATPTHIHKYLLELKGFSFKGKNMITEEAKSKQKGKMEIRSPKIKTSISHFTSVFQRSYPKETPNQRHVPRNNNQPKLSSDNNHKN